MITETILATEIIRQASRFVGLREVVPNAHWDNPATPARDVTLSNDLRAAMRPAPWQDGWPYCAAFAEGVVALALLSLGYQPYQISLFTSVHTPHVMTNVRQFGKRNLLSSSPSLGALWLARHGTTDRGHEGICTSGVQMRTKMATIEANTSLDPAIPAKEREGDWITTRVRNTQKNGLLVTQGFISPAAILKLVGQPK